MEESARDELVRPIVERKEREELERLRKLEEERQRAPKVPAPDWFLKLLRDGQTLLAHDPPPTWNAQQHFSDTLAPLEVPLPKVMEKVSLVKDGLVMDKSATITITSMEPADVLVSWAHFWPAPPIDASLVEQAKGLLNPVVFVPPKAPAKEWKLSLQARQKAGTAVVEVSKPTFEASRFAAESKPNPGLRSYLETASKKYGFTKAIGEPPKPVAATASNAPPTRASMNIITVFGKVLTFLGITKEAVATWNPETTLRALIAPTARSMEQTLKLWLHLYQIPDGTVKFKDETTILEAIQTAVNSKSPLVPVDRWLHVVFTVRMFPSPEQVRAAERQNGGGAEESKDGGGGAEESKDEPTPQMLTFVEMWKRTDEYITMRASIESGSLVEAFNPASAMIMVASSARTSIEGTLSSWVRALALGRDMYNTLYERAVPVIAMPMITAWKNTLKMGDPPITFFKLWFLAWIDLNKDQPEDAWGFLSQWQISNTAKTSSLVEKVEPLDATAFATVEEVEAAYQQLLQSSASGVPKSSYRSNAMQLLTEINQNAAKYPDADTYMPVAKVANHIITLDNGQDAPADDRYNATNNTFHWLPMRQLWERIMDRWRILTRSAVEELNAQYRLACTDLLFELGCNIRPRNEVVSTLPAQFYVVLDKVKTDITVENKAYKKLRQAEAKEQERRQKLAAAEEQRQRAAAEAKAAEEAAAAAATRAAEAETRLAKELAEAQQRVQAGTASEEDRARVARLEAEAAQLRAQQERAAAEAAEKAAAVEAARLAQEELDRQEAQRKREDAARREAQNMSQEREQELLTRFRLGEQLSEEERLRAVYVLEQKKGLLRGDGKTEEDIEALEKLNVIRTKQDAQRPLSPEEERILWEDSFQKTYLIPSIRKGEQQRTVADLPDDKLPNAIAYLRRLRGTDKFTEKARDAFWRATRRWRELTPDAQWSEDDRREAEEDAMLGLHMQQGLSGSTLTPEQRAQLEAYRSSNPRFQQLYQSLVAGGDVVWYRGGEDAIVLRCTDPHMSTYRVEMDGVPTPLEVRVDEQTQLARIPLPPRSDMSAWVGSGQMLELEVSGSMLRLRYPAQVRLLLHYLRSEGGRRALAQLHQLLLGLRDRDPSVTMSHPGWGELARLHRLQEGSLASMACAACGYETEATRERGAAAAAAAVASADEGLQMLARLHPVLRMARAS